MLAFGRFPKIQGERLTTVFDIDFCAHNELSVDRFATNLGTIVGDCTASDAGLAGATAGPGPPSSR